MSGAWNRDTFRLSCKSLVDIDRSESRSRGQQSTTVSSDDCGDAEVLDKLDFGEEDVAEEADVDTLVDEVQPANWQTLSNSDGQLASQHRKVSIDAPGGFCVRMAMTP
jgi:hypothetical protein